MIMIKPRVLRKVRIFPHPCLLQRLANSMRVNTYYCHPVSVFPHNYGPLDRYRYPLASAPSSLPLPAYSIASSVWAFSTATLSFCALSLASRLLGARTR